MSSIPSIPRGWNASEIGDLTGKKFLITGGTSGIGKEAARELVRAGAHVTIPARDAKKGEVTALELGSKNISVGSLDLTSLESIHNFAKTITTDFDVLILNAGVMATPLSHTKDGFELQLGTNHLGHFALAGLLQSKVTDRIVSVSSQAHRMGNFGDGSREEILRRATGVGAYKPWGAYGDSKLANLLFTNELQRRIMKNDWQLSAYAVHPGYSNTNLQNVSPAMRGATAEARVTAAANALIAQSASRGALPTLCAATHSPLVGASYIGPDGFLEMRGFPKLTRAAAIAYDQGLATNLWAVSEELTGVTWG
ncbi:FabG Dehydrogenases with different specificities (related to short-chain alcohol dehydrogenases) [Candidatus Nanopelagicaceae bacterium]